jgi:hypothetical protein
MGDIIYIPKGKHIFFATPDHARYAYFVLPGRLAVTGLNESGAKAKRSTQPTKAAVSTRSEPLFLFFHLICVIFHLFCVISINGFLFTLFLIYFSLFSLPN